VGVIVVAAFVWGVLILLLARFGGPLRLTRRRPRTQRDPRPGIPPSSLRALTVELLGALGMTIIDRPETEAVLLASRHDELGDSHYLVVLAPAPRGGVVDPQTVLELVESVKAEHAASGMLITDGEIDATGLPSLEVPLELVDGPRFRRMIADHLPERLSQLDRYRGFGVAPAPATAGPVEPRPA
jgi:hypothetical protein